MLFSTISDDLKRKIKNEIKNKQKSMKLHSFDFLNDLSSLELLVTCLKMLRSTTRSRLTNLDNLKRKIKIENENKQNR